MSTYAPERVDLWCGGVGSLGEERNAAGRARSERRWVRGECAQMCVQSPVRSGRGGVESGVTPLMCSLAVLIYVFCACFCAMRHELYGRVPAHTARRTECGDDSPALPVLGREPVSPSAFCDPPGPRRGPRANTTGANNALQGTAQHYYTSSSVRGLRLRRAGRGCGGPGCSRGASGSSRGQPRAHADPRPAPHRRMRHRHGP